MEMEGMVACDCCDKWFHYGCVGVTDAVKRKKKWYCDDVACQDAVKEYQKKKEKKSRSQRVLYSNAEESDVSSVKSHADQQPTLSIEERRKALQEEQKKLEEDWEKEKQVREEQMKLRTMLKKKKLLEEREMKEKERRMEMEMEEELRELEFEAKNRELEEKLQAKRNHLKRMQQLEKNFDEQMSLVDQQLVKTKQPNTLLPLLPCRGSQGG